MRDDGLIAHSHCLWYGPDNTRVFPPTHSCLVHSLKMASLIQPLNLFLQILAVQHLTLLTPEETLLALLLKKSLTDTYAISLSLRFFYTLIQTDPTGDHLSFNCKQLVCSDFSELCSILAQFKVIQSRKSWKDALELWLVTYAIFLEAWFAWM